MEKVGTSVLLVPGLWNSGPQHWQTLWQARHPEYTRVMQRDWEQPVCSEWTARLDEYVTQTVGPVVVVSHSLGCATVAHWAARYGRVIRGALLVAPSDVEAPNYPAAPQGFTPMPLKPLGFPSVVVASSNDVYISLDRAQEFARAWGSRLVNIGDAGHINGDAGYGEWPEGERILAEML